MPGTAQPSSRKTLTIWVAIAFVLVLILGFIFLQTGKDLVGIFTHKETTPTSIAAQPVATQPSLPAISLSTAAEPTATRRAPRPTSTSGAGLPTATQAAPPVAGTASPAARIPSWVRVFFTVTDPPDQLDRGIDRQVIREIERASQAIDLASFDLNLPSVVNALVAASQRGVRVRVIVDGEQGNLTLEPSAANGNQSIDTLQVLKDAKIPLVDGGRTNGLMHNKFILIDGKVLFMGSWNVSYNDTFRNDNNLLRITAPELIANYQAKFNEGFEQDRFGAQAELGALQTDLVVGGVRVENYFSPPDEGMIKLVNYVRSARQSIRFMAFTYTYPELAQAMIARHKKGVKVEGVFESRGASQGALASLHCAKVPVKVDGNKYTMHHKAVIIDDRTVITGSFNFTATADKANDDNLLVIHDPALAALFLQEYARVASMATPPNPAEITCK
jgi:phosphatidylserine/phosphatidylglycerophosphate/cardiolipin synthase-like enzyme